VTKRKLLAFSTVTILLIAAISTQLTIFVVQPIGAIPEGRTLVISRLKGGKLVDSADAMCRRIQGNVNLLCRGMLMGRVVDTATIYARLPYSRTLYLVSTGGDEFDR
jgi:hypothetical protein